MATVRQEFTVGAAPEAVWDALRDFGALHTRLVPGFVTACTLEEAGQVRRITFANGVELRERLVGIDEEARRLAYTVVGGTATHHHASAQVLVDADGATRFVWITDVLPDAAAVPIGGMMVQGAEAIRRAFSSAGPQQE